MAYKLATKQKTGYKGKQLTDENVNSFSERLLLIWAKAGIVKKISERKTTSKK